VGSSTLQNGFNLLKGETNDYSVSSICQFTRFYYPNIIISIFFTVFLTFVKSLEKIRVIFISDTIFYVKGQWKIIEYFLTN
jgi:hypothetical protein